MTASPAMSERTPLLASSGAPKPSFGSTEPGASPPAGNPPHKRVHFLNLVYTCFLLSMAFAYTASTLYVEIRRMACDVYYEKHAPYEGDGDRCAVREIESTTAIEISTMGLMTTISSLVNLIFTGWTTRKFGVKFAMIMQTTVPSFRNLCQQYAVYTGGQTGIYLLQYTQLITCFGGGGGYLLTANTYTAELVAPEERTASFGKIQGAAMLGMGAAFSLGGLTTDTFGSMWCFRTTWCLLVLSSTMSFFALPYIGPAVKAASSGKSKGWFGFLAPLRMYIPRKLENGRTYYGISLLAVGVFMGVLAGGYVNTMLQLHSMNEFNFSASMNGYLLSLISFTGAFFLSFVFPKIIAAGRAHYARRALSATERKHLADRDDHTPPGETALPEAAVEANAMPVKAIATNERGFDLEFVRWSMVLDGVLTGACVFATRGWHMYLAAFILPWASGTAPAAKGVVMELVNDDEKASALQGIAFLETAARISTISLFGWLFSYLSELGRGGQVFVFNAGIALLSAAVLLLVRFPTVRAASGAEAA